MYRMITMLESLKRPRDCGVPDMDIGLNVGVLRTEISLLISSPQSSHMHLLSDPCIKSTSSFFFYLVDPVKGSKAEVSTRKQSETSGKAEGLICEPLKAVVKP